MIVFILIYTGILTFLITAAYLSVRPQLLNYSKCNRIICNKHVKLLRIKQTSIIGSPDNCQYCRDNSFDKQKPKG